MRNGPEELALKIALMPSIKSFIARWEIDATTLLAVARAISKNMSLLCNKLRECAPTVTENAVFTCCFKKRKLDKGRTPAHDSQCKDLVLMALSRFLRPLCLHMRAGLFPLLCVAHRACKVNSLEQKC